MLGIITLMTTNEYELPIREFQDRGVQKLLELPENMRGVVQLVAREIAEKLDFSRAERIPETFIQEDLRKWETDVLYRLPCTDIDREVMIYLLLEHQSTPDRLMGLRIHNYMTQVWDMQSREWSKAGTPVSECWLLPVIPMVLYTGKRRWSALPTLESIMRVPEAIAPFIPRYETLFLNLLATPPEQLQGSAVSYALRVLQVEDAPLEDSMCWPRPWCPWRLTTTNTMPAGTA